MSNKKQTALDFLVNQLIEFKFITKDGAFTKPFIKQAKAMEKEQIENSFCDGNNHEPLEVPKDSAEQYYNDTYEHTTK